jgi:hypothetical protein
MQMFKHFEKTSSLLRHPHIYLQIIARIRTYCISKEEEENHTKPTIYPGVYTTNTTHLGIIFSGSIHDKHNTSLYHLLQEYTRQTQHILVSSSPGVYTTNTIFWLLSVPDEDYSRNYYDWVDASPDRLFVPESTIHPVDGVSPPTWFLRYIYYWNLQFLNYMIINQTNINLPRYR